MTDSRESQVQSRFLQFLQEFKIRDPNTQEMVYYYQQQAEIMKNNERTTLHLDYAHVSQTDGYQDIALLISTDFYQFENSLKKALQEFMFLTHQDQEEQNKQYFVAINNVPATEKIRDLKAEKLGKLTSFIGTVTRTYEVRPELLTATFQCQMCDRIIEHIEQQFKFTEPKKCINPKCDNKSKWTIVLNKSIFTDFQKVRVQEDSKDIPAGSMPRSIDVILHNEKCDSAKPGDKCTFNGYLTVIPDIYSLTKPGEKSTVGATNSGTNQRGQGMDGIVGLKQLGVRDLCYRNVFVACHVESNNNRFDLNRESENQDDNNEDPSMEEENRLKGFEDLELREIMQMKQSPDLFKNLAESIAPAVHGYTEIKKGILLMLMGGLNKQTKQGVNLRGDINVCIVGDPSTAKSQFLKFTCQLIPRSVYTSGKASSAAGLTASVHRDLESNEFCIEAGALMLADNGVCCIDEFDKMESKDQVAIHEAMEQQTISIAKAGIHATLNARTSILAAANPIFGRYDKSKSLKFNVNMSQPIMSRFDLFFVVTDQCSQFVDEQIANHIVRLHSQQERAIEPKFSIDQLRRYLRFARTYKPMFCKESAEYLRIAYIRLREQEKNQYKGSYRITVRQLESMVRLSEALARVYCDDEIKVEYVKEAEKLLSSSILSVEEKSIIVDQDDDNLQDIHKKQKRNIIEEELNQRQRLERQKQNRIEIASDEYYTIARAIQVYMVRKEQEMQEEIVEVQGVKQEEILDWYISNKLDEIQTEEQIHKYERVVGAIIKKMIKDRILIVVKEHEESNQRYLAIHPNLER